MLTYTFAVESFRKLASPLKKSNSEDSSVSYVAICNVKHLPLDIPTEQTNPRNQDLKHQVAKQIINGFLTDKNFWLLNRGILISADSVSFDNNTNKVTLTLTNGEKHGNVDGGHTYKVIKDYANHLGSDGAVDEQFVRLELVTGAEDFFENLSRARNTSKQVELTSISELTNKFEIIKKALKDAPFLNDISFKEFEDNKRIDVKEVVAIASMFNLARHDEKSHPVSAYSSKQSCLKQYLKDVDSPQNEYEKMKLVMPDLFKLHSYIEKKAPEAYATKVGKNAKFGKIKGVMVKDTTTLFTNESIKYEVPSGFVYPVLAAFRALLEEKDGVYQWVDNTNPFKYFDDLSEELVYETVERSRSLGHNPQSVGKDSPHWGFLYSKVQSKLYKQKYEELQGKKIA